MSSTPITYDTSRYSEQAKESQCVCDQMAKDRALAMRADKVARQELPDLKQLATSPLQVYLSTNNPSYRFGHNIRMVSSGYPYYDLIPKK